MWVCIDRDRLAAYAATLRPAAATAPGLDPERHYLGQGEATVAFLLTLDAINFGSGYFPHLRKRPGLSGYFTVASALTDRFRAKGPLSAERLVRLTAAECTLLFGQDPANAPVQELMHLFARALNDLGRYVLERFNGSPTALVEAASGSAERLVGLLRAMPGFEDVATWRGRRVPLYKRAQIAAADLALAFGGEGWGRFHDLDRLTLFADNLVPHVLRVDGVLRYQADLAARIDREDPIPAGSAEEVEIRASALHAVELMVAELRQAGLPATAMRLDHLLWNRGQAPAYKQGRPRHRTRSVFY